MSNDGDLDRNVMKFEATEKCKFLARRLLELKDSHLRKQLALRKMKEGSAHIAFNTKKRECTSTTIRMKVYPHSEAGKRPMKSITI